MLLETTFAKPAPMTIPGDPAGEPITVQQAGYAEEAGPAPLPSGSPSDLRPQPDGGQAPQERPWMLLIGTAVALGGSLGANVYLFWVLRDAHRRYLSLAGRMADVAAGFGVAS